MTTAAVSSHGDIDGLLVVHEDDRVLVVDKPPGLLSQPGIRVRDSVVERVRAARPEARGPLMMHRLDMDTSGLLVLAKDADAHRALGAQFERREILKRYRARLERAPTGLGGRVALALRKDLDDPPRQIVCARHGRPSLTLWRLDEARGRSPGVAGAGTWGVGVRGAGAEREEDDVGAGERCDIGVGVVLYPLTGRTHQLRVHAADPRGLHAPIVGDRLYGGALVGNGAATRRGATARGEAAAASGRLMLHAETLVFRHPDDGRRMRCTSPAPFAGRAPA